jgi:hypothetical protein
VTEAMSDLKRSSRDIEIAEVGSIFVNGQKMIERLFAHRRDLLIRLDLVFMGTTSLYFEGAGGQNLGRRGYSKDHRRDLRQSRS